MTEIEQAYPIKKGDWVLIKAPLDGMVPEEKVRIMSLDFPEDMIDTGMVYYRKENRKIGKLSLKMACRHLDSGSWTKIDAPKKPKKKKIKS